MPAWKFLTSGSSSHFQQFKATSSEMYSLMDPMSNNLPCTPAVILIFLDFTALTTIWNNIMYLFFDAWYPPGPWAPPGWQLCLLAALFVVLTQNLTLKIHISYTGQWTGQSFLITILGQPFIFMIASDPQKRNSTYISSPILRRKRKFPAWVTSLWTQASNYQKQNIRTLAF